MTKSWNKTSTFLIPCVLSTPNNEEYPLSQLEKEGLVNAFIDDHELHYSSFDWYKDTDNMYLYLLFKPKSLKTFTSDEEIYKKFNAWVDYYDLSDGSVMHVFKINDSFKSDVELFKLGLYSRFSEKLKSKYTNGFTIGVVRKHEATRQKMSEIYGIDIPENQEYLSRMREEDEVYRFKFKTVEA